MRKTACFILLYIMVLICVSCSIHGKIPESGLWYCEELNTSIDFDLYQRSVYCVNVYNEDGSAQIHGCHLDQGTGISFFTDFDGEYNEYFNGCFKYDEKKQKFLITSYSEDHIYVFERMESQNSN